MKRCIDIIGIAGFVILVISTLFLFLMTGMREQEVMHFSWEDLNLSRGTVTVRYKPEYGFSPKNYQELQRARSAHSSQAGEGSQSLEGKRQQNLRLGIPNRGMQAETGLSRLFKGVRGPG